MVFRVPSYYKKFRCTAGKCTDNCCIGWEIAIDSETADFYKSFDGVFGKRLRENISDENIFILKDERCPFLNDDNLCDIIINCGENRLCQICRDHPRFFNWYGNIKEGGIGLSCEEGARLVLTHDSVSFDESEVDEEPENVDGELFDLLFSAREEILSIVDREDKTLCQCLCDCLDFAQKLQFVVDNPHLSTADFVFDREQAEGDTMSEIMDSFGEFEPIDESWTEEYNNLLERVSDGRIIIEYGSVNEKYLKNIFRYFIWRYFLEGVFDEEILSKVKFAAVSVIFIWLMVMGKNDLDIWVRKNKLYSKQMEYSEENREMFYSMSYERECYEVLHLKKLMNRMFRL